MTDENLPRRFGKYTLIRHLATGGMAEIYLAIHRSIQGFEKLVVIKRILQRYAENDDFIRMFLDEARVAATLNHPNIIQIFDVGSVGKEYFIAMEYVHGEDLRSIVGAMRGKGYKQFPLEMALGIARGLLKGLGYAHGHRGLDGEPLNIVHRDISPQNTIVTFPGEVKIVDFGIARAALAGMEDEKEKGALRGKFPYMSPEQCRGRDLDMRSDLFSVAIILFELTVGRRLFKGKNEIDTIRRIVELPYPVPSSFREDYPSDLEMIVMRGLEKDREMRYESAAEMLEDIERFVLKRQLKVSALEMSRFMEDLFADKLQQQAELMKEGKKLADIIAEQEPEQLSDEDFLDLTNIPSSAGLTPGGTSVTAMAPARKKTSPIIFAVIGVLVLAVGGLGAFLGWSVVKSRKEAALRIGVMKVASEPEGATVWIDGAKQEGVTPLGVEDLKVGTSYKLKITREGYEPFEQKVELTRENPKFTLNADLVALGPVGDGVLKLAYEPRDAKVIVDGKEHEGTGEVTVTGLEPGVPHTLLVQHPEYEDHTEKVKLAGGEVLEMDLKLEPRPLADDEFMLSVTTTPEGASVTVDGKKLDGVTPLQTRLTWKKAVEVEVDLARYRRSVETVKPGKGEKLDLELKLKKKEAGGGGGGGGGGTATSGEPGKIRIDSQPWANAVIPGVGTFTTPFTTPPVKPGTYTVVLSNPGAGLKKKIKVKVEPGKTVTKKVKLQ